jgi:hypothetical protein
MFLFFSGSGVTVNALHPGVARTELGRHTGMHNSAFSGFMLGESLPAWCPSQSPLPVPSLLGDPRLLLRACHFIFFDYFSDWVSLYISDWLRTCYVGQAGLELTEICFPLSPECWD